MNMVDILLAGIILLSAFSGFQQGFIKSFSRLMVWLGSLLLGLLFFDVAVGLVGKWFPNLGQWTALVALLVPILLFQVLLSIGANAFVQQFHPDTHRSLPNKMAGILPGLANGWITAIIVTAVLFTLPSIGTLSDSAQKSSLAQMLDRQAEWIGNKLPQNISSLLDKTAVEMPTGKKVHAPVSLPFTVKESEPRPELEAAMLELVNKERQKEGLQPLEWDAELVPVARAHSRDMFLQGYFAHENKEGLTPAQRIKKAGIRFRTAGENLALGPTIKRCHTGLMNSPGHRANILNPAYGRIGIGVLDGGIHGLMITQNFRN